jgi:DegV family protein with EDD domain
MTVKIITDSTSDIPAPLAAELGLRVIPLYVHFGNEVYRDGIDLSTDDFYKRLVVSKRLPTTSTVSPSDFAQVCDTLAHETDEILAIMISSKLSATYDVACQGRDLIKATGCRVEVMDSQLICLALGLIVIAAAKEAQRGSSLDQVIAAANDVRSRLHVRMAFDTLEYVRRGGRIGAAQALLGNLLHFKPILTLKDGVPIPVTRERTRAKAIDHLLEFARGVPNIEDLALASTTTPEDVEQLMDDLAPTFPRERIYVSTIGSVMGTHLGPGAIGVAVVEKKSQ